jgi:hypothetical protein
MKKIAFFFVCWLVLGQAQAVSVECAKDDLRALFLPAEKLIVGKVFADAEGVFLVVEQEKRPNPVWTIQYIHPDSTLDAGLYQRNENHLVGIRPVQSHSVYPKIEFAKETPDLVTISKVPNSLKVIVNAAIVDSSDESLFVKKAIVHDLRNPKNPFIEFCATANLDDKCFLRMNFHLVDQFGLRVNGFLGEEQFQKAVDHFSKNIRGIFGYWIEGTNHSQFYEGLRKGLSLEEAALNTWTGRQAVRKGFKRVRFEINNFLGSPFNFLTERYPIVKVIFY